MTRPYTLAKAETEGWSAPKERQSLSKLGNVPKTSAMPDPLCTHNTGDCALMMAAKVRKGIR